MIFGIDFNELNLKIGFLIGSIIILWLSYRFVKWIVSTISGASKASKVEKMEPDKYVIEWFDKDVIEREIERCIKESKAEGQKK